MIPSSTSSFSKGDYLEPNAPVMDSTQSPLAMLALTCSSIGKDFPANKLPTDKPPATNKSSPRETTTARDSKPDPEPSREASVRISTSPRALENNRSSRRSRESSPTRVTADKAESPVRSEAPAASITSTASAHSSISTTSHHSAAKVSAHGLLGYPQGYPSPYLSPSMMGHGGLVDPGALASLHAYQASMMAAAAASGSAHPLAPPTSSAAAAGLSPYAAALMYQQQQQQQLRASVCRDPLCAGACQVPQSPHSKIPCPPGCTQCSQDKTTSYLARLQSAALGLAATSHHEFAAAAALAHKHPAPVPQSSPSALPYSCNWLAGSDFCGKRFTSSEELLAHVRTHTTPTEVPPQLPASLAGVYPGAAAAAAAAAQAAQHKMLSESLASHRYHPYSKPPGLGGASSSLASLGALGLSPYSSLFSQRLGSPVAP